MDAQPPCPCTVYIKSFLAAIGDPTPTHQSTLERDMALKYKNVVGELIYALVTCCPDISFAVIKCAQATTASHKIHYHALRHILKYLYVTRNDGIYFWCHTPHDVLPDAPNPPIVCPTMPFVNGLSVIASNYSGSILPSTWLMSLPRA